MATNKRNKIREGNNKLLGSVIPKLIDISLTLGSSKTFSGSPIIVINGITNMIGIVSVMPFINKKIVRRNNLYLLPSLPSLHRISACFIR